MPLPAIFQRNSRPLAVNLRDLCILLVKSNPRCGCDLQSPLPPPSADFAQLHLKSGEFLAPADTDSERLTMLIPNCTCPLKLLTQWTSPAISHRRATRFHLSKVVTCSPAPGNVRNWTYSSYVSGGVQMSTSHN